MRKDVGVDGDAQRIGQLGWMVFYKIFSDQDAELELNDDNYDSPLPLDLRWDEWADSNRLGKNAPTGEDLLKLVDGQLFPTLKELAVDDLDGIALERAKLLRSVFQDAYNYMKSGTLLRQVVDKINESIDFNQSQTRNLFGDIYEQAAIVLPDGTLFGEGIKTRIKQKLLRDCNLHTIVRLPNGVFSPYTSIRTNVLFFTKGEPTTEVWYYEHPYPLGVKSYNKTKPMRIEEFEAEKAWWEKRGARGAKILFVQEVL
jgi:type I restriction-modification system DNA methylase subunit